MNLMLVQIQLKDGWKDGSWLVEMLMEERRDVLSVSAQT
jgi:hypothetical protein